MAEIESSATILDQSRDRQTLPPKLTHLSGAKPLEEMLSRFRISNLRRLPFS